MVTIGFRKKIPISHIYIYIYVIFEKNNNKKIKKKNRANRAGPALTRMGCEPIRAGSIDPDFIRATNFTARSFKISDQFKSVYRARPILSALYWTKMENFQKYLQD